MKLLSIWPLCEEQISHWANLCNQTQMFPIKAVHGYKCVSACCKVCNSPTKMHTFCDLDRVSKTYPRLTLVCTYYCHSLELKQREPSSLNCLKGKKPHLIRHNMHGSNCCSLNSLNKNCSFPMATTYLTRILHSVVNFDSE